VFLASGLWHGAAWGYIIWGSYHGLFLVIERSFLSRWLSRLGRFAVLYTFPVVMVGWVFFRLEHWTPSIAYLRRMLLPHFEGYNTLWQIHREHYTILAVGLFFAFLTLSPLGQRWCDQVFTNGYTRRRHIILFFISNLLLFISVGRIFNSGFNPFIYFRF
jgi:alginate O-acetyltransferase complex protein AlgI